MSSPAIILNHPLGLSAPLKSKTGHHVPTNALGRKTDNVALRILKSPLFHTVVVSAALITFTAVVLTGAVALSLTIGGPVAGVALIGLGVFIGLSRDKIWYEISLLSVRVQSAVTGVIHHKITSKIGDRHWYDPIYISANEKGGTSPSCLYLGAIPLAGMKHYDEILNLAKKQNKDGAAILTVLQKFENGQSSIAGDPVKPADWKKLGVDQKQIEIFDLQPIEKKDIDAGVDFINDQIENHHKIVYVHCKAGRGRSAMMIIGYMLKYRKIDIVNVSGKDWVEKAIKVVSSTRPQIDLSRTQIKALRAYSSSLGN